MLQKTVIKLIKLYRAIISPALPRCCRFYPTCSEYAEQAIEKYGLRRGTMLAAKRILSCQPLSNKSGFDPLL